MKNLASFSTLASSQNIAPRRLTVFGSTGLTGRKIVDLALSRGDRVTVLVRDRSKLSGELAGRVNVVEGSAVDPVAVEKAIPQGSDAVLSALGHTKGSPRDLETVALGCIVASMRKNGVRRLVVLANTAVSDPADRPTSNQRFYRWLAKVFRREIYEDSLTKGPVVKNSDLDWTMARTSLLTDSPPTGKYRVGPMGKGAGVRISRGDMAEFMLECATEGKYVRECPYVSQ